MTRPTARRKGTPVIDLDTPPHSLAIAAIPERHMKDLTPREVNQVEELKTFFVPPATKSMDGKKVVHGGILFYKSGGSTLKTTIPHAALSPTPVRSHHWDSTIRTCSTYENRWDV